MKRHVGDSNKPGFQKSPKDGLVTRRQRLGRGCLPDLEPRTREVWVCIRAEMRTRMPDREPWNPALGEAGELAFGRSFSRRQAWILTTCIYHMQTGAETRAPCPMSPARGPSLSRKTREKERREDHLDSVPFKTKFIEI